MDEEGFVALGKEVERGYVGKVQRIYFEGIEVYGKALGMWQLE